MCVCVCPSNFALVPIIFRHFYFLVKFSYFFMNFLTFFPFPFFFSFSVVFLLFFPYFLFKQKNILYCIFVLCVEVCISKMRKEIAFENQKTIIIYGIHKILYIFEKDTYFSVCAPAKESGKTPMVSLILNSFCCLLFDWDYFEIEYPKFLTNVLRE